MKIIHCADLHLDSSMGSVQDPGKRKERKAEILGSFVRLTEYAHREGVSAVLIAGDLFDKRVVSATAVRTVLWQIRKYPGIQFYYLKGNHDCDNFLQDGEEIPGNLFLFGPEWITYRTGQVTISGMELTRESAGNIGKLELEPEGFHIVMLHGQETEFSSKEKVECIPFRELRNRGIDYLALGHIHAYREMELDGRGIACYSGCLEPRGYDEFGEHGFVLLEVEPENAFFRHTFIPFATRKIHDLETDITGCQVLQEVLERIRYRCQEAGCRKQDLLCVRLTGEVSADCEKDAELTALHLRDDFYEVKIKDQTRLLIRTEEYLQEESLRGEFVRLVSGADGIDPEQKNRIMRYGLCAIAGEEVQ